MRKFIFGLLVGGIAVLLWQRRRMRAGRRRQQMPESVRPRATPPESGVKNAQVEEPVSAPVSSQPDAVEVRPTGHLPGYETAPLSDYRPEFQTVAEELFQKAVALIGREAAEKCAGSYSFLAKRGTTAAKIIIYERGRGREIGAFPMLRESVYILLRTQQTAQKTLGIAPKEEERFHYLRVDPADLDAAAQDIADVLHADEQQWQRACLASRN